MSENHEQENLTQEIQENEMTNDEHHNPDNQVKDDDSSKKITLALLCLAESLAVTTLIKLPFLKIHSALFIESEIDSISARKFAEPQSCSFIKSSFIF